MFRRLQDVQADVQRLRGRSQELDTELERARGTLSGAKDKTQYPEGVLGRRGLGNPSGFEVSGGGFGVLGGLFGCRVSLDPPTALRRALEELQEQLRQLEQRKEDEEDPSLPPDA